MIKTIYNILLAVLRGDVSYITSKDRTYIYIGKKKEQVPHWFGSDEYVLEYTGGAVNYLSRNLVPYGFSTTEYSNLMSTWFKHGGLLERWAADKKEEEAELAYEILSHIEDVIREDLYEYATSYEQSSNVAKATAAGLFAAIEILGKTVPKEGEY